MSLNQPIKDLEKVESIPQGTAYVASMGNGSGVKAVTQEVLTKTVGEGLKIGNLEELNTENKESIVAAINEAAKSGGGGGSLDVLDTKEEIEANTEPGKPAGALGVKEMVDAVNNKLNGCSIEQDGEDFYIVGADAVRKKLGSSEIKDFSTTVSCKINTDSDHTVNCIVAVKDGVLTIRWDKSGFISQGLYFYPNQLTKNLIN